MHIFVAQELDSWSILQYRQGSDMSQSRKGDDLADRKRRGLKTLGL